MMNRDKAKLFRNELGFIEVVEKPNIRDLEVFYKKNILQKNMVITEKNTQLMT